MAPPHVSLSQQFGEVTKARKNWCYFLLPPSIANINLAFTQLNHTPSRYGTCPRRIIQDGDRVDRPNSKTKTKSTRPGKGGRRWYKDVGLGFRTPKTAIEGSYIDKKCPFTGLVSIRGRILTGTVVSTKMHRTIIIRREYLHFIPKYSRYEKRHKNVAAHVSPAFRVEEGDQVTVGQCRPLSKTVRFNVLRVLPRTGKAVKKFSKF
ncbi:hypothetical protein H9Q73_007693 [Fusarium xylarioides]|nr:hypothetical protein H9Q73_007693 [Fusarium xylarioides]